MPQTIILDTALFTLLSDGATLFLRPKIDDVDFIRVQTPDGIGLGFTIGFNGSVPYIAAPHIDCGELKINGQAIGNDQLAPITWNGEVDTMDDAIRALIDHANLSRQGV